MAQDNFGPRKRRTRQHIIADLSVHHVEGFILEEGHIAQRMERDYGCDLLLFEFDEQGYLEPGQVNLQLKAAEASNPSGPTIRSTWTFGTTISGYASRSRLS